ncbi:MAG: protein kinase domain-containing protein [Myxococcota bacterium]
MHPSPSILHSFFALLAQAGTHIDIAEGADQGGGWQSGLAIVFGAIIAVGIIAGIFFAVRSLREKLASNTPRSTPDSVGKETRRRVKKALSRGDYEGAGDLLVRAGEYEDASEIYLQGKSFLKAARAFRETGNLAQAIHYFKKAGEYEQAALLYAKDGQHRAAAAEFHAAQDFEKSAEHYEAAGDHRRAAENYERVDRFLDAARNYEQSESFRKAAQNYKQHFEQRLEEVDGELDELGEEREYARKAGEMFRDAGDQGRASEVFHKAGFLAEAADCLRTSGDFTRAADLLMQAKQPLRAAQVLEEGGQKQKAARMRAEAALIEGDRIEAAELFQIAGDYDRAAELFEDVGRTEQAAILYEDLEEFSKAAELFEEAEKFGMAARCAEAAEKLSKAAELYGEAGDIDSQIRILRDQGDYFRAGRLLFEHRRFDEGLAVLESIDSSDPIYLRSLELQGDIYRAQGRYEKAYSRYRSALGNREVDKSTLPLFYKMARSLEEEQDLTGALDHYNAIVDVDSHFEDAKLRLEGIQKRLRRGSMPGTSNSGIFQAQDGGEDGLQRRYDIIDEVARGGMGIVYRARDTVLGRVVAFKILGENLRDNETAVKYFLREARAAAALSHPNIVTIYDAGEQDGEYYMAMEFVEGTTLKQLIKRTGALSEDKVRYILINCCRALHYAHSKGVIHRDIKSGNVMLTRDKSLKIMDFGLAKFLKEYQNNHTQQVGTPFYMSPEQIIGKDIDFRSDLYSLGCTVYECATGTVPFFKGDLSYHHVHTKPPGPRSINPALSKDFERVILKLLAKDPDERFQSAKSVIELFAKEV